MGDGDAASSGTGRRCPKHPSEPPFTGFCSACLLDRLHATNLIGVLVASPSPSRPPPRPPSLPSHNQDLQEELPPPCSTGIPPAAGTRIGPGRTTLLRLFQLEDQGEERDQGTDTGTGTGTDAAASTSGGDAQDPPPHLQRKRSLRHSCSEWIACCDAAAAANHSSCLPSRQSLDASSSTTSASASAAAAANNAAASAGSNCVAMVERRTGSLRWNPIKGFLAGHLLNRSFSESSRSSCALHPGGAAIATSSSSQSQGIRLNGSHSVSSAGNGMDSSEISLPGDSVGHAHVLHHCRPRLEDRLHWLRRSRSVHYSSPTTSTVDAGLTPFRSRSSSTRSTTAHKNHHPRLFPAGFFATQRYPR